MANENLPKKRFAKSAPKRIRVEVWEELKQNDTIPPMLRAGWESASSVFSSSTVQHYDIRRSNDKVYMVSVWPAS